MYQIVQRLRYSQVRHWDFYSNSKTNVLWSVVAGGRMIHMASHGRARMSDDDFAELK